MTRDIITALPEPNGFSPDPLAEPIRLGVRQFDRTDKTKGCFSRKAGLAMAFMLIMLTQRKWQKSKGTNRMPKIIQGIDFVGGIKQAQTED